jgi:thiamine-phosphate pyrophosphorylase
LSFRSKRYEYKKCKKNSWKKIIGITCHNSIKLAKAAIKENAELYCLLELSFPPTTKKVKYKATTKILNKVKKLTKTPIVAIGGINFDNYKKLLLNKANLLAISGYIWNNKKYKPLESVERLK